MITGPDGFIAGGVHAGLKRSGKPDLAYLGTVDGAPVAAAAVFTANKLTAAPVLVSRAHLAATGGWATGVITNSGNANAATGSAGLEHAERMCHETAAAVGCDPQAILVCSTGLIGIPLPIDTVSAGIPRVVAAASRSGGGEAAEALKTTDTVRKQYLLEAEGFTVGAMAKGSAMLEPNMATMLGYLTTDAAVDPATLRTALIGAVAKSFNRLTVDGAQSTNDTVVALASGHARAVTLAELEEAFTIVCRDLVLQMADDAEGSTKTVTVAVVGAKNDGEALHAARRVANCQLVKCSWYGRSPYWGRIAAEVGASNVEFDDSRVSVAYGPFLVAEKGVAAPHDDAGLSRYLEGRRLTITVDLGLGSGTGEIVTTDLTHGYVDENMGKS